MEDAKGKLEFLKESNIIDESEYLQKRMKIDEQINDEFILNTKEYKNLKSLFDSNILSENEFKEKTEKLKTLVENNKKPKRYIKEIRYAGDNHTIKMGTAKEYHLIMDNNKAIKIFEKKINGESFCYDKNNMILLFPNKEACIKHIEERI